MGKKRHWVTFEKMAKTNLICQKTSPLRGVASFLFVPFGKLKKIFSSETGGQNSSGGTRGGLLEPPTRPHF